MLGEQKMRDLHPNPKRFERMVSGLNLKIRSLKWRLLSPLHIICTKGLSGFPAVFVCFVTVSGLFLAVALLPRCIWVGRANA
jgi:hypothetical protein